MNDAYPQSLLRLMRKHYVSIQSDDVFTVEPPLIKTERRLAMGEDSNQLLHFFLKCISLVFSRLHLAEC